MISKRSYFIVIVNGGRIRNIRFCMRHSGQMRAARALLGWRQNDLADAAGVGLATIRRLERSSGMLKANVSTAAKIQAALERAGVQFIERDEFGGIGVRLKKIQRRRPTSG